MKISIAMATFNGAKYLEQQLDSFLKQTKLPDELIITDDCSVDETEFIVKSFSERAPFSVSFTRNETNLGYCGNFNASLMKTTGDLVFLSDQDDVWFPNKIEFMVSVTKANPNALVLLNDAALTDGGLNEVGLTKLGQIRSGGFKMNSFIMGCCCIVRRELLYMCLPIINGFASHDGWIVGMADGLNAKLIDEHVLQFYRRHESNESDFIANRTSRLKKWSAYTFGLKRVLTPGSSLSDHYNIEQMKIFIIGVERALDRSNRSYRDGLLQFKKQLQSELATSQARVEIRQKPLVLRLVLAMSYYIRGRYRHNRGLLSMIRDCLGDR